MRALLLALLITPALFQGNTQARITPCAGGMAIVYRLPPQQAHELCPVILEQTGCSPYVTRAICRRFQ